MHENTGFTLVELLIVIAILAVLAVAVVLVLNPAELLRQARDSTRLSDLSGINSALSLWVTDVSTTTWPVSGTVCTSGTVAPSSTLGAVCITSSSIAVDGTGWVRSVNFNGISIGSPLARLPIDPVNNSASTNCTGVVTGCYYAFKTNGTFGQYKLFANMESTRYAPRGLNAQDGGNVNDWYESGTNLSL